MHELSLMQSVMDTVRDGAQNNNIIRVKKIKLVIGKLSQALPDSLQFAFEALSSDSLFQGAVLEIEERSIKGHCQACGSQFSIQDDYCFICPVCQGFHVDVIEGRELFIDYFEGDTL
ncbi:MAG TPA: hydrogenase maturation nickel metallochaperone HypA [Syntrophomonadaceae bacterium]|nr:hydrogenase maturation nickel metallochaperone HypA [Syntrophomonadaceae bacterium]